MAGTDDGSRIPCGIRPAPKPEITTVGLGNSDCSMHCSEFGFGHDQQRHWLVLATVPSALALRLHRIKSQNTVALSFHRHVTCRTVVGFLRAAWQAQVLCISVWNFGKLQPTLSELKAKEFSSAGELP